MKKRKAFDVRINSSKGSAKQEKDSRVLQTNKRDLLNFEGIKPAQEDAY